ncbi:hypothetical protein CkaCkLH20_10104 [Colletotrichum karsti]|uniref:Uncharacterized protein n=1 Tax=Colletotrichum karsti TaxID=1095194 RepID=A0A9P6HW30_9PEZI|nr:uncharacterized protein CkaCkLH20_10104 [Colletotrichum karsti]KAF9872277.1 hypothetical protein CkaCkLH20_10104 [Colletotrichum karsti]
MDALKNIINNVPDWVQQLDKMGDEIDQRQAQLAALSITSSSKSLRNKGSTESLKLKDENDDAAPAPVDGVTADEPDSSRAAGEAALPHGEKKTTHPSSPSSETPSALQKQTKDSFAKAQAYARAEVKKRVRTESVMSDQEGGPSKYRSKTQVEVFYDEFVEKFFEDLVKFVSASRNLMRKAKMAAKVAHIRRMAELEGPGDGDEDDSGDLKADTSLSAGPTSEALPSLRYMSTRRMGPRGAHSYSRAGQAGGMDDTPGAYDELDKNLEYVQGTAEHAAHQFLRDGQCREEIANIQRRLVDTKELAAKEMERVEREEPELLKAVSESNKVRTLRPTSMRRELTPAKDSNPPITPRKFEVDAKLEADTKTPTTKTVEVDMSKPLEADDAPIEADDEGIDDMEISLPPRLNYRSTRAMRGPPRQ